MLHFPEAEKASAGDGEVVGEEEEEALGFPPLLPFFWRPLGGCCSTLWTAMRWRLKTSARLKDFSRAEPEPGQKPQTMLPL